MEEKIRNIVISHAAGENNIFFEDVTDETVIKNILLLGVKVSIGCGKKAFVNRVCGEYTVKEAMSHFLE